MRGHTLIELLLVLTLMGVTTASLAPTALAYRDRAAVVAAREAFVGVVAGARAGAMETGSGLVRVDAADATARAFVAGAEVRLARFRDELGVEVDLAGDPAAELRFNALGLGVLAGRTVVFRRGAAEAEVVVSSYGRVRRR